MLLRTYLFRLEEEKQKAVEDADKQRNLSSGKRNGSLAGSEVQQTLRPFYPELGGNHENEKYGPNDNDETRLSDLPSSDGEENKRWNIDDHRKDLGSTCLKHGWGRGRIFSMTVTASFSRVASLRHLKALERKGREKVKKTRNICDNGLHNILTNLIVWDKGWKLKRSDKQQQSDWKGLACALRAGLTVWIKKGLLYYSLDTGLKPTLPGEETVAVREHSLHQTCQLERWLLKFGIRMAGKVEQKLSLSTAFCASPPSVETPGARKMGGIKECFRRGCHLYHRQIRLKAEGEHKARVVRYTGK